MITVRFQPLHGQDHVFFPDLSTEFGIPSADAPDYVQEREFSDSDAAIALSNPNFVDAASGVNPNFTCDTCGEFHTHTVMTKRGLETSPVCIACEAKASAPQVEAAPPARDANADLRRVQDARPIATPPADKPGTAEEIS